jgi:hypothetical protein
MNAKQLAMVAAACGVLTLIGVLLPWATFGGDAPRIDVPRDAGPAGDFARSMAAAAQSAFAAVEVNGTGRGFNGTFVLILGLLGGAAAAAYAFAKPGTLPLNARQLLFVALGAFALGLLLTFVDLVSEFGPMSRGIGIYLTFLATLAGAAAAFLTLRKTPATATAPA